MKEKRTQTGFEIAVIGMAGRFPGSKNIDAFWENLKNGVESLSFLTEKEAVEAGVESQLLENPNYVRAKGGELEKKEQFDASFFGYTPAEAELMDPQFRLFHECAWNALEHAGYDSYSYEGAIGLYAGSTLNLNWHARCILTGKRDEVGEFISNLLTNKDFLCTRVSYKLNLQGPSVVLQSACSTSLLAIHTACRALLMGECDIALAGGISVTSGDAQGYLFQEGMILSPDGHCRAFDAKAKGTVDGNGVGLVVLKRLKFALRDRDTIHAVILASSINNDGLRKVGFTAPSVEGQAAAIKATHHIAKVPSESVTYIETHGTGTPLGDPIEIEALKTAFDTDKKGFCRIGSVKTNIGHLDSAAGAAGIIKTILALKHRLIPPSLHFQEANPKIDFQGSPFCVNTEPTPWENDTYPLRAGVSSFGIGGTNAHILLEEAPEMPVASEGREWNMVMLSAKTPTALEQLTKELADHLKQNPHTNLADLSYTLQVGRTPLQYRKAMVCPDIPDAIETLASEDAVMTFSLPPKNEKKSVVFLFPGLGAQYVNMGLELYRSEPVFREEMERCFDILSPITSFNLKKVLYPGAGEEEAGGLINRIDVSQLAIFVFEYALAKLLLTWGLKPRAMVGYSFGEYVAAQLAGVFSLEEALELVAFRGQLMSELPRGLMLSVPMTEEALKPTLPPTLSIAIDNGPSCVVAGAEPDVEAFEKEMKASGYLCMRLPGFQAVHSAMMEPILPRFEFKLNQFALKQPTGPYLSNVTGKWDDGINVATPKYWSRQLRETVRFKDAVTELSSEADTVFIEVGPGRDLSSMLTRFIDQNNGQHVVNLIRPPQKEVSDIHYLMRRIGRCWLYGMDIDWESFHANRERQRIPLPQYPFEGQRYWIDDSGYQGQGQVPSSAILPGQRPAMEDWFYIPSWSRSLLPPATAGSKENSGQWLMFVDDVGVAESLVRRLRGKGINVTTVSPCSRFEERGDGDHAHLVVNPLQLNDYEMLMEHLESQAKLPEKIVHLWGCDRRESVSPGIVDRETLERGLNFGFYSLLYLAKALGKRKKQGNVEISVITTGMQEVTGQERLCPEKSIILGPIKVIPQEQPNIICRSIDLELPERGGWQEEKLMSTLENELLTGFSATVTAIRGNNRWVRSYEAVNKPEAPKETPSLKEKGVYFITGGLGDIGLILAEFLVKRVGARVVLIGRSAFPAREEWDQYLTNAADGDPVTRKLQKIKTLEAIGGKLLALSADVADKEQMANAIRQAEQAFGRLNGVIHAAGLTDGRSFNVARDIDKEDCEEQFQAKVYGVAVLDTLLKEKPLDFCWLISSISAVLGGLRFSAYAAANCFIDAFTVYHNQQVPAHWTSILWEGMSDDDSIRAFERIFGLGETDQVVVSCSGYLQERIDRWINLESLREEEGDNTPQTQQTLQPRPQLMTPYCSPQNDLEKEISEAWRKMFGYEKIGIDDDFFELGGDSLKAITLIARLHREFNVEVPLAEFFDAPTVKEMAQYVHRSERSAYSPIKAAEKKEYYPLSSAQKRFYVLQQMEPETTSYNQSQIMVLDLEIQRERFEDILKQLIQRHESLRTSIKVIGDEPVQRIHLDVEFSIDYYETDESEARELVADFVKPFDLKQAPFMRVALIKLAEAKNILLLDMHHIVTDAVSFEIFSDEFLMLYEGRKLLELPLQYKDYSEWQNSKKEQSNVKKQEEFWLREMGGQLPILDLPTDFDRPAVQSFEGSAIPFSMGADITGALRELSKTCDATLYMTLLSIFVILMARLSGQEDILVGTPVAGRRHADLDSIMGIFINTVVLRNFPNGNKTFSQFLREVRERTLAAFDNQEYQFEDLVEKVWTRRDKSRNPLFNVMFNMQTPVEKAPGEGEDKKEDNGDTYELVNKIAKFDLQLFCTEIGNTLSFSLEYCTKLYRKETIEKYITYFEEIAAHVVEKADGKLEDISIAHGYFDQQISVPETDFAF